MTTIREFKEGEDIPKGEKGKPGLNSNIGRIKVGGIYDYKESYPTVVQKVKVIKVTFDEKYAYITLKVLKTRNDKKTKIGSEWTMTNALTEESFYYEGMGRFFDSGDYIPE